MPCLFFGAPQPQVAHITSSSFVGQRSQSLLACRLCLHQASSALETSFLQSFLQSSCNRRYSLPLNNRIHNLCTLFFTRFRWFRDLLFSRACRDAVRNFFAALHFHAYLYVAIPTRVCIFSHCYSYTCAYAKN